MSRDERLAVLIDRWEKLRAQGQRLTPEELGRETPELIPQLREWIERVAGTESLEASRAAPSEPRGTLETPVATASPAPSPPTMPPPLSASPGSGMWQWAIGGVLLAAALGLVVYLNLPRTDTRPTANLPPESPAPPRKIGRPPPANAPFTEEEARMLQVEWARYLGVETMSRTAQGTAMLLLPPGEFVMGATQAEIDALANEPNLKKITVANSQGQLPRHVVRITRPFRLCLTEVTFAQFEQFVKEKKYQTEAERDGQGGSIADPDTHRPVHDPELNWAKPGYAPVNGAPVTQVSWNDAAEYCNWLSRRDNLTPAYVDEGDWNWRLVPGTGYRLPTEAEWEFACRAGTTTRFYWGEDAALAEEYECCAATGVTQPQPRGEKKPNPFGLFDMAGNVREWVGDWYEEDYYAHSEPVDPAGPATGMQRLQRGSQWLGVPAALRSAHRARATPSNRHFSLGFRLAQTVPMPAPLPMPPATNANEGKPVLENR